ncbi:MULTISPECIES: citrate lyase holo-[acyl-carrier protein] synthase [Aerococcus]|uniref:citrate lyase holo-[acyl-carrier protein] synthase n=1 Tax=Aerococcus sanguinicola TaxID=119206 RepID=A0A5N1GNP8_9LACT|nr:MULTISPECIES: citrate lyase holo-[acyl-carrier protein] synthase [Aerococcus]KAA9301661.1 citrate lyase holo-[acyl-carrier protein] synthase [Aerococcus sanguinicola]MDK6368927.1 citrate lyase holo-[acyl-carrier protein] synthase [Aerococcus sp. UMB9870]MDK6680265.1 citrate lyase holo-[acyl-carrier protein] synthase [Aerococcus sp. UMB8608]MDK6687260.1 citrate lyase holo-[acyl-carrier protein] synthase [Aerococcus sp. UMB8623]MDK6940357.1 citrate lyase holo-[acyl-carrier protein] synthase [
MTIDRVQSLSQALQTGPLCQLEDALDAREARAELQESWLKQGPAGASLVALKLNMPGPYKRSPLSDQVFDLAQSDLRAYCLQAFPESLLKEDSRHTLAGEEYFALIDRPVDQLKSKLVELEEDQELGRLMDIDCLYLDANGQQQSLSRQAVGLPKRQCFVCQADANLCARSRKHDFEEIYQAIAKMIVEDGRIHDEETN